jgi:hypothetical protein
MLGIPFAGAFFEPLSLLQLYYQWEAAGIFQFLLPAILIFAVIFGILTSTKVLGDNRGVVMIISLAIAIIAIRTPVVSDFFTVFFPGVGIGIAVILAALILGGIFIQKGNIHLFSNVFTWGGIVIALIIVIAVFNDFNWFGSYWLQNNWTTMLWIILLVAVLGAFLQKPLSEEEKKVRRGEYVLPWGPLWSAGKTS